MKKTIIKSCIAAILLPLVGISAVDDVGAQTANDQQAVAIPSFRDPQQRLERPDLSSLSFVRFLTTPDFPPFNYITPDERIAGFNIDLGRALCEELELSCVVQVRPWDTLRETVGEARENAIIASVAIDAESRKLYDFTNRYLTTPARFAKRKDEGLNNPMPAALNDKSIGVVEGSAHERFIATYFPNATRLAYSSPAAAFDALKESHADFVFADGIALAFWLNGEASADCCRFMGGPYQESAFFGEGMAIAVAPGNDVLREALDFALDRVQANGRFEEIYLRHFPISIY